MFLFHSVLDVCLNAATIYYIRDLGVILKLWPVWKKECDFKTCS